MPDAEASNRQRSEKLCTVCTSPMPRTFITSGNVCQMFFSHGQFSGGFASRIPAASSSGKRYANWHVHTNCRAGWTESSRAAIDFEQDYLI